MRERTSTVQSVWSKNAITATQLSFMIQHIKNFILIQTEPINQSTNQPTNQQTKVRQSITNTHFYTVEREMNKSIVVSSKQRVSHVYYCKPSAGIGGVPWLLLQFLAILSLSSSFLIVCSAASFVTPGGSSFAAISPLTTTKNHPCCQSRPSVIIMSATNKPSGSFFNKVPDNQGGNDNDKNNDAKDDNNDNSISSSSSNDIYSNETNEASLLSKEDPIEQSLQQLIKSRNSKPRASSPSTMGGIPTSKVKGKCIKCIRCT